MAKDLARSSSPLVRRHESVRQPWHEPDWQRLWLATHLEKRTWRSLALVPGGTGMPPQFIEKTAISLSRTGMTHLGQSIHVADGTQVGLADLNDFLAAIHHCSTNTTDRVVIALAPLAENLTSASIARQCDCALLCVVRGVTATKQAKQTVSEIGASRFIGSVMFDTIG
jgi:hypothetical protein